MPEGRPDRYAGSPDRYAVIGHPVAHSLSPRIHTLFAQQTGEALQYTAMDIAPEHLVRGFFAAGGRGLNVTVPHKQASMSLVDELSARARRAGAVNTLMREVSSGRIYGDTTDGVGLVIDLTGNLGITIARRRLLLLGAGGAARGVLGPLLTCVPAEIVIANRTVERATQLAREWGREGPVRASSLDLPDDPLPFDLIIQATAAGLSAQTPDLPLRCAGPGTICYDMSYGRHQSPFIRWARAAGAGNCHMGLGMLVEQAAESFRIWRGVRPSTAPVLATLRASGER